MTMYSPNSIFLRGISDGLKTTGIPVYFKLPDKSVIEPFYVIGNHFDNDSPSAKTGRAIVDTELQVDLFYPTGSRVDVEEAIFKTKASISRRRNITSTILIDDSIGREVYHVVFKINDFII